MTIDDRHPLLDHQSMRPIVAVLTHMLVLGGLLVAPVARSSDGPPAPITREQANQLLETLKDPEKRERFSATLEAYVKALPVDAATTTPAAPAAQQPAKISRTAGAVSRAFMRIQTAATRLAQDVRTVTDLPQLSAWLSRRFTDSAARNALVQGCLWIALIAAITLGAEALLRLMFHRRRVVAPAIRGAAGVASRTLPYVTALGAALIGNASILLVTHLPIVRIVALGVVNTYVAVRLLFIVLDELGHRDAARRAPDASPPHRPAAVGVLLAAFLVVVALQLLNGDVAEELGAPEAVQEALEKCIALLAHGLAVILVLVSRVPVSNWIRHESRPGTTSAAVTDAIATLWPAVAICAIAASWLVAALDIPDAYHAIIRLTLSTLAILLISRFVISAALHAFDRRMTAYASSPAGSLGSRIVSYRRAARGVLQALLMSVTVIGLTEAWGLPTLIWLGDGHPGHRVVEFALQLLVLVVLGIVCWEAADVAFERRVARLTDATSLSRATRLRTLQPIIRFALLIVIALLVVMTALNAIGINVGPLLAGASILGVALGFGSQKLVQDFITGIFLLVEDAMDVGDWVTLAGVSGTVEHISIRTIRLRAGDGSVHLIPFSSVTSVNNTNRGIGNASVTVNVDPSEDTDRVCALLVDIAREMRKDDQYAAGMQSDLQLWGVDKVDGSLVTIAGQIVCTDAARWGVQREFNRRMKQRFEEVGVKLALPQHILHIAPTEAVGAVAPTVRTSAAPAR